MRAEMSGCCSGLCCSLLLLPNCRMPAVASATCSYPRHLLGAPTVLLGLLDVPTVDARWVSQAANMVVSTQHYGRGSHGTRVVCTLVMLISLAKDCACLCFVAHVPIASGVKSGWRSDSEAVVGCVLSWLPFPQIVMPHPKLRSLHHGLMHGHACSWPSDSHSPCYPFWSVNSLRDGKRSVLWETGSKSLSPGVIVHRHSKGAFVHSHASVICRFQLFQTCLALHRRLL